MTRKDKIQLLVIWWLAAVCWFAAFVAFEIYTSTPAHAASMSETSDKYDGDCDPTATVGRCADKCPAPTSEGAWNQIGTDPTTGAAICHFVYANACPYFEAVSADDPMCYKNQPQQPAQTTPNTSSASNGTNTQSTSKTPVSTSNSTSGGDFGGAGASASNDDDVISGENNNDPVTSDEPKNVQLADGAAYKNTVDVSDPSQHNAVIASFVILAILAASGLVFRNRVIKFVRKITKRR